MAKVEIMPSLEAEIYKKFKELSVEVLQLLKSLEENPKKGKLLGHMGGMLIKELRYKGFRFYFIINDHQIRFFQIDELQDLLIQFVRMSNKKRQQKVISEIKHILKAIGPEGFY